MTVNFMSSVRDGAWFRRRGDGALCQLRMIDGPELELLTGELAFEDVDFIRDEPIDSCRARLRPGSWPTRLGAFYLEGGSYPSPAVCIVGDFENVVTWAPAVIGDPASLMDHGVACIYDAALRDQIGSVDLADDDVLLAYNDQAVLDGLSEVRAEGHVVLVMFVCGAGGGLYSVWVGNDEAGEPVCAVADLQLLHDFEASDPAR